MDRETIARRIKALLAKTVEHGASEAEAMSAAEKARELMAKYMVDADDLQDDRIDTNNLQQSWRGPLSVADQLFAFVARFCDCQPWRIGKANKFTGRQSDMLFATWLLDALDGFVNRKTAEYGLTLPIEGGHAGDRSARTGGRCSTWGRSAARGRPSTIASGRWPLRARRDRRHQPPSGGSRSRAPASAAQAAFPGHHRGPREAGHRT